MIKEFIDLKFKILSLTIFNKLKDDRVINSILNFSEGKDKEEYIRYYTDICSALFEKGFCNLSEYILSLLEDSENIYIKKAGKGEIPSSSLKCFMEKELEILQEIADLKSQYLIEKIDYKGYLPKWENKEIDILNEYKNTILNVSKKGYGIYAKYHMFYLDEKGDITPVKNPDKIRLSDLVSYKNEKEIILNNTKALLENKPASNILLTGDAGTGKSSTVKAVVNELYKEGLRIIEIRKDELKKIPKILDELSEIPLKFILFTDDLSFKKNDDNFGALKAILEGSVSAKSKNTVIYATSNRRHLVKEKFSDREGDDIHRNDTMQEIISLSERFGIKITFNKPDKKLYLDIVHTLAEKESINMDTKELDIKAESYALKKGVRSPRAAKQFIDILLSQK